MSDRKLPPGLDPVTAGRWGLWLLGQRSKRAAAKRTHVGIRECGYGPVRDFIQLVAPWRVDTYPSQERLLAGLCGVSEATAVPMLSRPKAISARSAERLAAICDDYERRARETAAALRAHAASRPPPYRIKPKDKR